MANNIGTIFDDFEKNVKSAARTAIKNTAKRVQNDLLREARKNIKEYYAQYDPDVYERTYDLEKSIFHTKIFNQISSGDTIEIDVGFKYDSMGPHTFRGGSQKYGGSADPEWIFENFLEGIHPRTTTGYEYYPIKDISQNQLMDEYVNNKLQNKIYTYMQKELIAALSKFM